MNWKFDEPIWSIVLSIYKMSDFIDINQMDVISIYPVKELIDSYGNIMLLIVTISEKDTETFLNILRTHSNDAIANGIDVLLKCAIDNDCTEITMVLLDYKYTHGLIKEKDWEL